MFCASRVIAAIGTRPHLPLVNISIPPLYFAWMKYKRWIGALSLHVAAFAGLVYCTDDAGHMHFRVPVSQPYKKIVWQGHTCTWFDYFLRNCICRHLHGSEIGTRRIKILVTRGRLMETTTNSPNIHFRNQQSSRPTISNIVHYLLSGSSYEEVTYFTLRNWIKTSLV